MKTIAKISIRSALLGIIAAAATGVAAQQQQMRRPVPGEIETHIDRLAPGRESPTRNGWQHYFIPPGMADTLTVKVSCVYNGTSTHTPHSHFPDETFYILRGPVRISVNGEERVLQTGDFYYTPSGSTHNIQRTSEADTIKYLMFMRETTARLDKPFRATKPGYTVDDCITFRADDPRWTRQGNARVELLSAEFGDGLRVVMDRIVKGRKTLRNERGAGKTAVYVVSGRADITIDGQKAGIAGESAFICPRGSRYTIRKVADEPLILLTVTTP